MELMTYRFACTLCVALIACSDSKSTPLDKPNAGPKVTTSTSKETLAAPKPPVVTDDSTQLVFSWFDPQKGHATGTRVAEVPERSRKDVVVADLSRTPEQRQSTRYVMIANLEQKNDDGTYSVVVQSRYRFAKRYRL